jgi:hypothetical protein
LSLKINFKLKKRTRAVALPFALKGILRQKEELWKTQNTSPCKNIIFKKIP